MIILIASKTDVENETQILNQLFNAGLECYHLSKPHKNYQEHSDFLNQIDAKYHNRIVVHDFHELTNEFDLKGVHFQEEKRKTYIEIPTRYFKDLSLFGKTISSTFHELKDLADSDFEFDYHLLSPIFSSASPPNPTERRFDVNDIDKLIIAQSGIDTNNIHEVFALGYKGIAVSRSVWDNNDPVEHFTDLKSIYDSVGTKL